MPFQPSGDPLKRMHSWLLCAVVLSYRTSMSYCVRGHCACCAVQVQLGRAEPTV